VFGLITSHNKLSSWGVESWAIVLGKRSGASIYEKVCSKVPEKVEKVKPEQEDIPQITSETEDTKECPYCAEIIKKKAKKCKHCGEMLEENQSKKLEEEKKREEERRKLEEERKKLEIERRKLEEEKELENEKRKLEEERKKLELELSKSQTWQQKFQANVKKSTSSVITIKGVELIKIPAGEFIMGSDESEHRVYLDEYYIGKYPVTNIEYSKFINSGGYIERKYWSNEGWEFIMDNNITEPQYWGDSESNQPNQPVVGISWYEAEAFCIWAGLKLPTDAQWEKAARGTDGRKYPWGNDWDCNKCCNSVSPSKKNRTCPVGSYPNGASPYGVMDMSGNVSEWCQDKYDVNYYKTMPYKNPNNITGQSRLILIRGSDWSLYMTKFFCCTYRAGTLKSKRFFGFRAVL